MANPDQITHFTGFLIDLADRRPDCLFPILPSENAALLEYMARQTPPLSVEDLQAASARACMFFKSDTIILVA